MCYVFVYEVYIFQSWKESLKRDGQQFHKYQQNVVIMLSNIVGSLHSLFKAIWEQM